LIGRRGFIAGAGVAVAMPAFGDHSGLAAGCVAAIRTQMAAFPAGPVLLNSYLVQTGPDQADFDITQANAAYVYDNALAGLLLLAAGHADDARWIGEALAMAQSNDRFWTDGRLRNAYQAGPMGRPAKLPGWWDDKAGRWDEDPYQVSSETGPVAWAMLLWAALGMQAAANNAGDWLDDQLRAGSGYYGGFYGFEPHPLKLTWQSTEQNTDLYAVFRKLGRAEDSGHAGAFVKSMFDPKTGVFGAGLGPDGARNPMLAADAGIWPSLAGLAGAEPAAAAIVALRRGSGIGFSQASESAWLEGTAFAALAGTPQAAGFLSTVANQLSPEGYVYATVAPMLRTGLTVGPSLQKGVPEQAFNYYRRPALSTTAWAGLAALGVNPLG
jgi:hypothetical protein